MKTGKITSVVENGRYFFIDHDFFCHFDKVQFQPQRGLDVGYDPVTVASGKQQANNVKLLSNPASSKTDYYNSLNNGYFDDQGFLREEFIIAYPQELARKFKNNPDLNKATQLRKYFDHIKLISGRYRLNSQFDYVIEMLNILLTHLNYAKKKGLISDEFYRFMEANIGMAKKGVKEFQGFVIHFQSLIAYY